MQITTCVSQNLIFRALVDDGTRSPAYTHSEERLQLSAKTGILLICFCSQSRVPSSLPVTITFQFYLALFTFLTQPSEEECMKTISIVTGDFAT